MTTSETITIEELLAELGEELTPDEQNDVRGGPGAIDIGGLLEASV